MLDAFRVGGHVAVKVNHTLLDLSVCIVFGRPTTMHQPSVFTVN